MRIILPDQVLSFSTQGFLGVLHVKEKIAEWVFSTESNIKSQGRPGIKYEVSHPLEVSA